MTKKDEMRTKVKVDTSAIVVPDAYPRPLQLAVHNLKANILARGLKDPIELEGPYPNGVYVLKHGLARLEAVKLIGLPNIPAVLTAPPEPDPEPEPVIPESAPRPRRGGIQKGYKFADGPRQQRKRERQAAVLPLLKEGLPPKEIAERLGWSVSLIQRDRFELVEAGEFSLIDEERPNLPATVGRDHTERALDKAEIMLSGISLSLDSLRPEDLSAITGDPKWEEGFKNAIRSMNRVRRLIKEGN